MQSAGRLNQPQQKPIGKWWKMTSDLLCWNFVGWTWSEIDWISPIFDGPGKQSSFSVMPVKMAVLIRCRFHRMIHYRFNTAKTLERQSKVVDSSACETRMHVTNGSEPGRCKPNKKPIIQIETMNIQLKPVVIVQCHRCHYSKTNVVEVEPCHCHGYRKCSMPKWAIVLSSSHGDGLSLRLFVQKWVSSFAGSFIVDWLFHWAVNRVDSILVCCSNLSTSFATF